ncbi:cell adhesion molecule 4 [Papio anubis]|uniref:cell adhesion molecule 4 n=1 Tax=Papio anubis TaxID=9555 RepID=UPI0012ADBCC5|nr:cell adhesion molecule 4 [Papio anubis]
MTGNDPASGLQGVTEQLPATLPSAQRTHPACQQLCNLARSTWARTQHPYPTPPVSRAHPDPPPAPTTLSPSCAPLPALLTPLLSGARTPHRSPTVPSPISEPLLRATPSRPRPRPGLGAPPRRAGGAGRARRGEPSARRCGCRAETAAAAAAAAPGRARRFQWPLLLLWAAAAGPGAGQEVQTENVTVAEGGVAEITCRLHQYDGSIVVIQNPARQTLFFNGTRALKDERFQLEEFSPRRVRIRLSDARLEDEGGYFCQLYTEDTHHQIATLTVLVAPENPVVEVREQAVEGGEVELSCLVPRSRPAATLRWYRDRKELKGVSSSQENGKVWSVASTVRFRVDRKDDGGIIICEAQNQALPSGHSKQTQYVLDVQYSPTARIHASQAVVREGDTLVLTCAVTGNPRPNQIRWNRGNESLPERAEAVGETLTLPGLVSADNGTYTCEASNKHGHARALYVLVVYDPGAVVEAQTSVPYAIVGGILALLVFLIICVLVGMVWCSVRQKGSYLTHEASGLDEQGEAREAFLNGSDGHKRKEEFFI